MGSISWTPPTRSSTCSRICDSTLERYTASHELVEIRTANMGSLYQLEYEIRMKQAGLEKRMIDEMRTMNGNLKISLGRAPMAKEVL